VTPPDDIPGADAETVRQTYARTLFNVLESAYPSASLGAALTRSIGSTASSGSSERRRSPGACSTC
ncbi:hypothetical protein, partial [Enhygromyxa salina]|uniref:hypothetical protein n=1 Tax=Enhygromyxa salina TaxID=215803 RepID=UPI001C62E6CB